MGEAMRPLFHWLVSTSTESPAPTSP
jgi:hypothetical protein